ncbi:MAG TPA: hypothetical protein PKA35_04305 [Paracoccus solventivorans]|uniref:rolling circle replication-associated protein n=1 Tax=Paracoccus solventivorans TaxID=53463 RepID=UPI002BD66C54|nr:hypothetical protein [Paracoccus solventivorans]HMM08327.1 hypothetical protein [Paracoccus solventivorans]
MCINPQNIWVLRGPKYENLPVPCKKCWRCKQNRVNDYAARCMAEAVYSERTCAITLTYAPRDDLADKILHPKHFQLFMKLLRRAGHKVRYLVVGEYGDLKGRTHFHAILFFQSLLPRVDQYPLYDRGISPRYKDDYPAGKSQDDAPFCSEIPQKRMVHIREWPHGHIKVDWRADERAIRYVCKYLLKGTKEYWFSLSKKPTLGYQWFQEKAAKARELGVLPSGFEYLPPGGNRKKPYLMTGATRRDYLNAITMDPADQVKMSEWVQKTFEKHHRKRVQDALEIAWLTYCDNYQPTPEEIEEAAENQAKAERLEAWLRNSIPIEELKELLDKSETGILRWSKGAWVPELRKDQDHGET